MTARTPQRAALLELLDPVVSAHGYDLEDVSVTAAGRRSLIRVVVDADGGIDLDAVADVSRAVSEVLDDESRDPGFSGPYVLEVTSPGVDRPLTEPRHWRRAVGRLVLVTVADRPVTARVIAADDAAVVLDADGHETTVEYARLGRGKVQVEFARSGSGIAGEAGDASGGEVGDEVGDDEFDTDEAVAEDADEEEEG
ncbi:ribosome maturation factor RimP [Jatrophihabitans telluris]|uniref:Ribosome maturation factor RimP n=2 Tax=Jatrophihabitans telluris TaxID=2038343 RepID=A0ABY4R4L6_9ACTN|nr:ribosome maturation factor RimP [Jatrophihabitans telluris]UQX90042.1 ribosome maturation factor RimP [Jatrophihabitans telluris]